MSDSEREEQRRLIEEEINAKKQLLRNTDYQVTKYAEGLTDCTSEDEIEEYRETFMTKYGTIIANRKAWRARINELEEELDELG